jgi:hypothetical protein
MDIFSTQYLSEVVRNVKRVPSFFLDTFFSRVQNFVTEEVYFDEVTENPRVAPFVHPMQAGKIIESQGFQTKSFKPAYVKPLLAFTPNQAIKRMAGEALSGSMTPQQRMLASVAQRVSDLNSMWLRRLEIMAAEAVIFGRQTIKGEGFDKVVSFGRDGAMTFALIEGAKWDVVGADGIGTADIPEQIEAWGSLLTDRNCSAEILIMDTKAWAKFRKNRLVMEDLDRNNKGSSSQIITSPMINEDGVPQYKGMIGSVEVWVYNATYTDPLTGASTRLLADNTAVLTGRRIEGVRCFGAIMDLDSLVSESLFVKSYTENNPSVRYILGQSAPLMVPYRANGAVTVTVA